MYGVPKVTVRGNKYSLVFVVTHTHVQNCDMQHFCVSNNGTHFNWYVFKPSKRDALA